MKKASHGLLTAEKVFDIIALVLFPILMVGLMVVGIVLMVVNAPTENAEQISLFTAGIELLCSGVSLIFALPPFVVSLIFTNKALATLENCQTRAEARKSAIMAIVAGYIAIGFAIPAGIMMLCMRDEAYQQKVIEQ